MVKFVRLAVDAGAVYLARVLLRLDGIDVVEVAFIIVFMKI